jgi:hypothetical protein
VNGGQNDLSKVESIHFRSKKMSPSLAWISMLNNCWSQFRPIFCGDSRPIRCAGRRHDSTSWIICQTFWPTWTALSKCDRHPLPWLARIDSLDRLKWDSCWEISIVNRVLLDYSD